MIANQYTQVINSTIERVHEVRANKESWEQLKKGKFLTISNRKYQNHELKMFKIEGTVPTKLENVQKYFFENNEAFKKNREQCAGFDVLEVLNQDTVVTVFKLNPINNTQPRETLNVRNRRALNDNEFLIISGHLEEHAKLPRKNDVIRSETIINAIYLTKIDANNTKVEIYFLNDSKFPIPPQVVLIMTDVFLSSYEKDIDAILSLN